MAGYGFSWNFASRAATGDHASQFTGDKNIDIAAPTNDNISLAIIVAAVVFVMYFRGKS